jgi:hypothetical protein
MNDLAKLQRTVWPEISERRRLASLVRRDHLADRRACKRPCPGQQLVRDHTEAKDVDEMTAARCRIVEQRFRRHVRRRPCDALLPVHVELRQHEPEVHQHDPMDRRQHDVVWLDVAMDEPGTVNDAQPFTRRRQYLHHLGRAELLTSFPTRGRVLRQGHTVDSLHDEVVDPAVLAESVNADQTGMLKRRQRPRLVAKRRSQWIRPGRLDRHSAVEQMVVRLEDLPHSAPAEQEYDFVDAVEELTRRENPVFAVDQWLARSDGMSPNIAHISIYILSC